MNTVTDVPDSSSPDGSRPETPTEASQPRGEIELLDEKAPRRIGPIPHWLTRCNLVVTLLFLLLLALAVTLIPYPYSDGGSILHHLLSR